MKLIYVPLLLASPLAACSSSAVNPGSWTCASLIAPVMESSKGRTPEILEITEPSEMVNIPNSYIECRGHAEWSEGVGNIEYGAHVTEGGNIVVEYKPPN